MKRKILIFSCTLVGLSIFFTTSFIYLAISRNYTNTMQREIKAESNYIKTAVELSGLEYLKRIDPTAFGHRVTLIQKDGIVLFDNVMNVARLENHLHRPEVESALKYGEGESIRYSDSLGKKTYYYAIQLTDGSILRVSNTTDSASFSLSRLFPIVVTIAMGIFALAFVIGHRVTRKLVRPLNEINLDNPEENIVYEEFTPLLFRLKQQKDIIAQQILLLRQKQIEFAAITDHMKEGFLVLNKEGHILSCNKSALSLLRTHLENPIHQNILSLNRSEALRTAIESALSGKALETMLVVENRYCQIYANPVMDMQIVQGAVVLLMDVTEREEREKLRREFTANVSHELKTPLTSISGYAEIIGNDIANPADIPHFAKKIYIEAQRLITLIGDILLLSKLDEKNASLNHQKVNLYELVTETISYFAGAAKDHQIEIQIEENFVEIIGVRQILGEMIFNLVDNAIKYNVEQGSVSIEIQKNASDIEVRISDTGIGIPENEQDRVFERFYRGRASRDYQIEGTGLGLSIVKHGAIIHNATIEIQSDGKSGTTIILYFPLSMA